MSRWSRSAALNSPAARQTEQWQYTSPDGREGRFEVIVDTGKALDVVGLKNTTLDEIRDYAGFLSKTAKRLYATGTPRRQVTECPCCRSAASASAEVLRIFGVAYVRCAVCAHVFVADQPSQETMDAVFGESVDHSQAYIAPETIELRLQQVVVPKVSWTLSTYGMQVGGSPATCLDIGAGAGHFVEGMRRQGVEAAGYELSNASRRFAREAFGLDLMGDDFLAADPDQVDILTMWGLLEYTPDPRRFLARARQRLEGSRGLLVVEVPRFDALGTVAQAENPQAIARHMDPTSHLNCFTDASLATALVEEGFRPVAAWYFGMDAYELLIQAALRLDDARVLDRLADMIPALQASCDAGRQCDDLIMAAVPT